MYSGFAQEVFPSTGEYNEPSYRLETHPVAETHVGALWGKVETRETLFKIDTARGSVWRLGTNAFERVEVRDLVTQKGLADLKAKQVMDRLSAIIIPDLAVSDQSSVTNVIAYLLGQIRLQGEGHIKLEYKGPETSQTVCKLSARFISAYDALKLVSDVACLSFRLVDDTIVVRQRIEEDSEVITRLYKMSPSFQRHVCGTTASNVLSQIGYPLKKWASLKYWPEFALISVCDTRRGHYELEGLLYGAGLARLEMGRFGLVSTRVAGQLALFLLDAQTSATWRYRAVQLRGGMRKEFFERVEDQFPPEVDDGGLACE